MYKSAQSECLTDRRCRNGHSLRAQWVVGALALIPAIPVWAAGTPECLRAQFAALEEGADSVEARGRHAAFLCSRGDPGALGASCLVSRAEKISDDVGSRWQPEVVAAQACSGPSADSKATLGRCLARGKSLLRRLGRSKAEAAWGAASGCAGGTTAQELVSCAEQVLESAPTIWLPRRVLEPEVALGACAGGTQGSTAVTCLREVSQRLRGYAAYRDSGAVEFSAALACAGGGSGEAAIGCITKVEAALVDSNPKISMRLGAAGAACAGGNEPGRAIACIRAARASTDVWIGDPASSTYFAARACSGEAFDLRLGISARLADLPATIDDQCH